MRDELAKLDHWVVKIGSAVLLRGAQRVDRGTFVSLVAEIAALVELGHRVTVVSSGAVALGRQRVAPHAGGPSTDLPRLQALAAIGQARLIQMYDREFSEYGLQAAQILLGRADLDGRTSFLNARLTLDTLHRMGVVAVVNENDTVATDELRFGDNDELAAMTCGIAKADLLVILSDVEGILDRDDEGELGARLPSIAANDPELDRIAGPSSSGFGRGGMVSKVRAARSAARFGCSTVIAPGKRPGVLMALRNGEDVGTVVKAEGQSSVVGRKVWLGAGALSAGSVSCDGGAVQALSKRGASLLPSGIVAVEGEFGEGSVIDLLDESGAPFARGIATYSSNDIRRIAGSNSEEIASILGYRVLDAVVHRDNLLLL